MDNEMDEGESVLPPEVQAQRGFKRGRRGRRAKKGISIARDGEVVMDHHAVAKQHLKNASGASNPSASMAHLFKALSSLKKAAP